MQGALGQRVPGLLGLVALLAVHSTKRHRTACVARSSLVDQVYLGLAIRGANRRDIVGT